MLKRISEVDKSFVLPLTDEHVAAFTEWNWDGWQNSGMRHVHTGKRHGVVRRITKFGHIGEASFKEGKCHGLNREISDKKITIEHDHEVEGIKNNKNLSDDQRSAALKNAEDTKDAKMKIKKQMSKISRRTDLLETKGLTGASRTKLAQLRTGVNNLREAAKDGVEQIDERKIDELSSDAKELEEIHV